HGRARHAAGGRRHGRDRQRHAARRADGRPSRRPRAPYRQHRDRGGRAMNDWLGIMWLVILLVINAFFVGAEFAVIAAKRSQIEPLADRGNPAAKLALWAMEHVSLMLAMCQLGITVCSLLILNVSEPAIHHLLEGPLEWT